MYIQKLTIRDFRCFKEVEVELNYPGRQGTKKRSMPKQNRNVNLFLGGNGTGKSSVFKAAALGVLAPIIQSSGFQAEHLVLRTSAEFTELQSSPIKGRAEVRAALLLDEVDADIAPDASRHVIGQAVIQRVGDVESIPSTAFVNKPLWERIFLSDSPAFFVAGYGANRRTERPEGYSEQSRSPRYQRVASIFEDHVGLIPFTYGYLQLQNLSYLEQAKDVLNQLLPDEVSLTNRLDSHQRPLFSREGTLLPFNALSDGFRAFVGWVWDLLFQLARVQAAPDVQAIRGNTSAAVYKDPENKKLTDVRGVVIVDEIDLFLHPEWQLVVVDKVSEAFPNLQFLFSTHSPLVAGTLEAENIFVLERGTDGMATVARYREDIHGLTANQILTSAYFGLRSTRAPGTGTLNDLALRETTPAPVTEDLPPLPDSQKEILDRLMRKARQREAALVREKG